MMTMSQADIDAMLAEGRIGRLCMAGADGRPYSVPLPFCWLEGALYLRVALTGRKGQVLAGNDRVCFEVDWFTESLDDYASVLIEGQLIEVMDVAEKERVRAANAAKYQRLRHGHRPGHGRSTPIGQVPLRKIVVEMVSGRRKETSEAVTATA